MRTATSPRAATGAPAPAPGPAWPFGLGLALAGSAATAAAGTFFLPGVLRGPDVMRGSARGTALVMLAVAVPVLLAGMWLVRRGRDRAVFGWLGATGYLIYNCVLLLFGTPFNPMFLLYVATLGLAVAGVVAVLRRVDAAAVAAACSPAPARAVAVFLWVIAAGNVLVWLKVVVPALGQEDPAFLEGTGLTTNPIYVQDLAFWLPLAAITGWWLWRRRPLGYLLAGSYLVFWLIEAVGVASDQWFGSHADPGSTVATMGGAYLFVVLGAVTAVPLLAFLRRPIAGSRAAGRPG